MADDETQVAPCEADEHRQFDFWIGEWEVRTASGELAGHNRIRRIVGGCGLREEWHGIRGLEGTSLNTYSHAGRGWHQTWIDSAGTLLLLDGGLRGDAMVLEGTAPVPGDRGGPVRHRISWSLMGGDPNHLRQHWETSSDGATWETVFDGRYRRQR